MPGFLINPKLIIQLEPFECQSQLTCPGPGATRSHSHPCHLTGGEGGPAGGRLLPEGGGRVQQPAGGCGGGRGRSRPRLAGQLQA